MMDPIQVAACAEELQKLAQGLDPQLLTALLGAGVGGYAGYEATHDPRNKVRNAILSALAGGGLGYGVGGMMFPDTDKSPVEMLREGTKERTQGIDLWKAQKARQAVVDAEMAAAEPPAVAARTAAPRVTAPLPPGAGAAAAQSYQYPSSPLESLLGLK